MTLYHFSDRGDLTEFIPRSPTRHPKAEPLVYAIDAWHSPLYLFPRDCPRIGVWSLPPNNPMRLLIDCRYEAVWQIGEIYRYSMPHEGFIDAQDHGVWVSHETIRPYNVERIVDLPAALAEHDVEVGVVEDLAKAAEEWYDFEAKQFRTSLHVSMVRMSLLPEWRAEAGQPVGMPKPRL